MEKHQLSKSTFIRGVQCLKALYLYKNRYFLRDKLSPEQLAKFKRGTDVGVFAQNLFPGGIDCKPKSPSQYRKSVEKTATVISEGSHDVIYEAAFQYDRVLILLDILAKQNGKWNAYEIKSSLKISETYLLDAALQYYVLTNSGIDLDRFFLVHINPDYVLNGELNLRELFVFVDVTDEVVSRQDFVKEQIAKSKETITLKKSPAINIGPHCHDPYPCDFIGHCWKHVPEKSVFGLRSFSREEQFEMYRQNRMDIDMLDPVSFSDPRKKTEVECIQVKKDFFDTDKFGGLSSKMKPPLLFAGLLAHRVAVPKWEGYKPFDLVPVSASVIGESGNSAKSYFNADQSTNPDGVIIDFIKNNFLNGGTILAYDADHLSEILRRIGERNPEEKQFINSLTENIVDLKQITDDFIYYHPGIATDHTIYDLGAAVGIPTDEPPPFRSRILAVNQYLKTGKNPGESGPFVRYTFLQAALVKGFLQFLEAKINKN